jgi:preprotein translocase SecE subunit
MANKTIDRRKAVPARSQAAKANPKTATPKTSRPSGTTPAKPSTLKPEKSASAETEVLEAEELDTEELVDEADEADEADDDEYASDDDDDDEEDEDEVVEEDEEEVVEEEPAKSRAKGRKDRDLVVSPQDYSVTRSSGSRLPNFPGSKFLYSSYRELRLVTWPSRRDTWNWSMVVVGVCIGVALLLGLADFGLSKFVTWWLSLAH